MQFESSELWFYLKKNSLQNVKKNIHARIISLPVCPELTRTTLPRTADVDTFLSITGKLENLLFHLSQK